MNKRVISLSLCSAMLLSLTSCGLTEDVTDVPLVPALSEKEVVDYYKQSMAYDTIATRTNKKHEVTYETVDVADENVKNTIIEETKKIEQLLSRDTIQITDGMNPNIHQYIKYVLDDKRLDGEQIKSVKEALGHYFVDVEYSVSPQSVGIFNDNTKYLGIIGAYKTDYKTNTVYVDTNFMNYADKKYNDYLAENPLYKRNWTQVEGARAHVNDINLYNKVAGMSTGDTTSMPELSTLYSYPPAGLAGYGLFPQGAFTLRDFGYSRSATKGKAKMRYVFKRDIMDPNKIEFKNVYVTEFTLDNKPEIDESAVIPDFVMTEAEKILERSDRAIANKDITGLVSGNIYDDIGVGILYGNMSKSCFNQRHMSKIKRIVGRKDHKYLLEIETLVQEGAKETNSNGTYVYDGYMVVQQENTEFHITDYVMVAMEMTKEPQINIENTILKRLAALNLAGEVTDEAKTGIVELMNKLYKGSTDRQLDEMYACFNTDTRLLSSTHREYLNSQLRGWLTKLGVNTPATYMGTVSQWIGGAENQVEFFTTELIDYEGKGKGLYMQNYYLVSNYDDKWVIDEMKVIESKDISGDELNSVRSTIQSGASASVENPDNNVKEASDNNN